jgi:phosphoribosylaminoimidazole carboxylase (NCAIR synthetase)
MTLLLVGADPLEQSTQVVLRDLMPDTQYTLKAIAVNNVGESNEATIVDRTSTVSKCTVHFYTRALYTGQDRIRRAITRGW